MDDELMAAVEGWRNANGIPEQSDAIGELVRIGLMSEIAKIYRLVTESRDHDAHAANDADRQRA